MRIVLQRVTRATLTINKKVFSSIDKGVLLLVGFTHIDTIDDINVAISKIDGLRLFEDDKGKMNLSLKDVNGEMMIVSQFTLYASLKKGKRPGFDKAMNPDEANRLYDIFVEEVKKRGYLVKTGVFGEYMEIDCVNNGPVTFILDIERGKIL